LPSKSGRQHRFFEAVAHDAEFAKKAGVPQSVGKDFEAADKGKTFPAKKKSRHAKLYGGK
jgi:hypothetical protein